MSGFLVNAAAKQIDAGNAQVKLLTLGYAIKVEVTRQVELGAFTAEYGFDFV